MLGHVVALHGQGHWGDTFGLAIAFNHLKIIQLKFTIRLQFVNLFFSAIKKKILFQTKKVLTKNLSAFVLKK